MNYNDQDNQREWVKKLLEYERSYRAPNKEALIKEFRERMDNQRKKKKRTIGWYWAAAAALVILFFAVRLVILTIQKPADPAGINKNNLVKKENKEHTQPGIKVPTNGNGTTTAVNSAQQETAVANEVRRQLVIKKDDQKTTLPADSIHIAAPDAPLLVQAVPDEPEQVATLHINDLKEPLPKNATLNTIIVKKSLWRFGSEMTGRPQIKNPDNTTFTDTSISNNQN